MIAFLRFSPIPGSWSSSDRVVFAVRLAAVVPEREAVGLVAHLPQQQQAQVVLRQTERVRRPGHEHLLLALGQSDHARPRPPARPPAEPRTAAPSWGLPPSTITRSGTASNDGS